MEPAFAGDFGDGSRGQFQLFFRVFLVLALYGGQHLLGDVFYLRAARGISGVARDGLPDAFDR